MGSRWTVSDVSIWTLTLHGTRTRNCLLFSGAQRSKSRTNITWSVTCVLKLSLEHVSVYWKFSETIPTQTCGSHDTSEIKKWEARVQSMHRKQHVSITHVQLSGVVHEVSSDRHTRVWSSVSRIPPKDEQKHHRTTRRNYRYTDVICGTSTRSRHIQIASTQQQQHTFSKGHHSRDTHKGKKTWPKQKVEGDDTAATKWSRHELDNGPNQQNNTPSNKIATDLHTDMNAPIWNSLWKRKHPVKVESARELNRLSFREKPIHRIQVCSVGNNTFQNQALSGSKENKNHSSYRQ